MTLAFDWRVAGFCAAAALLVGLLFGIAPAWQAASLSSSEGMGADPRTTTGGGGRLRSLLVVGEVATAVPLLFGAGLLLRTLVAVDSFDRGYRAESVLSLLVDPLGSKYPTPEALQQFYDQVVAEVRGMRAWPTWPGRVRCLSLSSTQADLRMRSSATRRLKRAGVRPPSTRW